MEPIIVSVLGYSSSSGSCWGGGLGSEVGQVLGWDVAASRSGVAVRGVGAEDCTREGGREGRVLFVAERTREVMIMCGTW